MVQIRTAYVSVDGAGEEVRSYVTRQYETLAAAAHDYAGGNLAYESPGERPQITLSEEAGIPRNSSVPAMFDGPEVVADTPLKSVMAGIEQAHREFVYQQDSSRTRNLAGTVVEGNPELGNLNVHRLETTILPPPQDTSSLHEMNFDGTWTKDYSPGIEAAHESSPGQAGDAHDRLYRGAEIDGFQEGHSVREYASHLGQAHPSWSPQHVTNVARSPQTRLVPGGSLTAAEPSSLGDRITQNLARLRAMIPMGGPKPADPQPRIEPALNQPPNPWTEVSTTNPSPADPWGHVAEPSPHTATTTPVDSDTLTEQSTPLASLRATVDDISNHVSQGHIDPPDLPTHDDPWSILNSHPTAHEELDGQQLRH